MGVLDASLARGKAKLMRRTERRLPGHVLAKRKAAEKLREPEQLSVMEQIKRELTDASQQVDLSDHQQDLENLNDEEKVDLIAKHMSKMETEYIMKLLKQLESGILDLSVPMLLPFLSLQVKLDLGRNIFKSLEPQNKVRVVKENFINDMISDITDIALLQEVIDRTQEKINFLCPPKPSTMSGNYFNIENDSFELPSTTLNIENDSYELPTTSTSTKRPVLTEVLSHIEKLMKEGNKKEQEKTKEQKEIKKENEKAEVPDATINIEPEAEEAEKIDEFKSSDESDEGLPPSDCDSSVVDEEKDCLNIEQKEEKKVDANVEKKDDIQDSIIDNKIDNKLADTSETKPKENNETVIKKKLRNILENCKTNEQSRPGRNFGRNFEFQNIELKPVLPNDKRTPKARRMDDMWMNSIASKQKWPCNNQLAAPKPKVPWTMNKNTQPQKREEKTEVKEFEKCHKNIKEVESKQVSTVKKVIQKSTSTSNEDETVSRNGGDCKVQSMEKKDVPKPQEIPNETEETKKEVLENNKKEIAKTDHKSLVAHPEEKKKVETKVKEEVVKDNCPASKKEESKKEESKKEEAKCITTKEASKYKQPKIDTEAPIDFGDLDTSHIQKDLLEE